MPRAKLIELFERCLPFLNDATPMLRSEVRSAIEEFRRPLPDFLVHCPTCQQTFVARGAYLR